MLTLLLIPLFAALYRCRGGFLGLGNTQAARIIWWAIPVALWGYSVVGWIGLFCGVLAFLGLLISRDAYQSSATPKDVSGMAGNGLATMSLTLLPLVLCHIVIYPFQFAGALDGAAYFLGWKFLNGVSSHISFPGLKLFGKEIIQPGQFATGGGEWAEVIKGAFAGLIFASIKILVG